MNLALLADLWKRRDIILLLGVGILIAILLQQCNGNRNLRNKLDIKDQNIAALNDSVRVEKDKYDREVFVKKTLMASNKELQDLNADLADEVKALKGKIIYLQSVAAEVEVDTQYVETTVSVYPGGKYSLDWALDTTYSPGNFRSFSGNSFFVWDKELGKPIPGMTRINEDKMGFSFTTGLREKDKALEIFITPKYPGMEITDIEGAIIDPQKSDVLKKMFPQKKWYIGPQLGVGVGGGYNVTGTPAFGPMIYLGVGIGYGVFRF